MRAPLIWAGGLIGSLAAHGVAFAFLNLSVEPDPTPTQPKPETQLTMDAYQVDRQDAPAQEAQSEAAPETEGESTDLSQGAIPQSKAQAQQPNTARLSSAEAPSDTLNAASPPTASVLSQTPDASRISPTQSAAQSLAPARAPTATLAPTKTPAANHITPSTSPAQTIASLAAPVETLQQAVLVQPKMSALTPPDTQTAAPIEAPSASVQSQTPQPQTAPNVAAPATATQTQTPDAPTATTLPAPSEMASQPPLPAEFATASLAFNFGDRVVTDPNAIATIQAFMAPQAIDGSDQVRDGLQALLTSVDCGRLSATYIPETGALELRGHVPDNALRVPVLKALQDQIGEGITVTDNLLHLPKPQCGALTGIADVGLPQSTDQFTNKRLIGDTAQAVEYTYSEGQPLAFDLTAPDYDAVVYVDYFDADGQVIHLVPNEVVPLQAYRAKEVVGIERGDGPKLNITIGPPFGQEIAVAFAASRPLFSEARPIIEPAEPYLDFLKAKVTEAREADPDFKGEWVYFFITTQPAS